MLAYLSQYIGMFIVATAAYLATTVNYSRNLIISMASALKLDSEKVIF
jgi:hypothetical protein